MWRKLLYPKPFSLKRTKPGMVAHDMRRYGGNAIESGCEGAYACSFTAALIYDLVLPELLYGFAQGCFAADVAREDDVGQAGY